MLEIERMDNYLVMWISNKVQLDSLAPKLGHSKHQKGRKKKLVVENSLN